MFHCHICQKESVEDLKSFQNLPNVSSDSFPVKARTQIGFCNNCHTVVKKNDEEWYKIIDSVYNNYNMYHQSNGAEKLNFEGVDGKDKTRSQVIVETILSQVPVENYHKAIDIGTGNGVMLLPMNSLMPHIKLWGHDVMDKGHSFAHIKNFEEMIIEPISDISGTFDIVSMIHVLEHIPDCVQALKDLHNILHDESILVINVPNILRNPIDLIVADHCTHFSLLSLENVLRQSGFKVIFKSDAVLDKELVFIVKKRECFSTKTNNILPSKASEKEILHKHLDWLHTLYNRSFEILNNSQTHVFGASLAGVWVTSLLENWEGCFVDEDSSKIGNLLLEKKIIAPNDCKERDKVFIPLSPAQQKMIMDKYKNMLFIY